MDAVISYQGHFAPTKDKHSLLISIIVTCTKTRRYNWKRLHKLVFNLGPQQMIPIINHCWQVSGIDCLVFMCMKQSPLFTTNQIVFQAPVDHRGTGWSWTNWHPHHQIALIWFQSTCTCIHLGVFFEVHMLYHFIFLAGTPHISWIRLSSDIPCYKLIWWYYCQWRNQELWKGALTG